MWRWSWLVMLAVCFWLIPTQVSAETSAEVTVTATGYICEAPGGFTITYINDYEVGLSWTKGAGAENTMVRAKYGSIPTDREDGYLIYYGEGTYATDTGINIDEMLTPVYYRAWSQSEGGVWEEGETTGFMEAIYMQLLAFIILPLGLTIAAYSIRRYGALFFGAAGAWALLCGYSYTSATSTSDIYFYLFILCGGMVMVSAIGALMTRETKSAGEPEEDDDVRDVRESMEEAEREQNQFSFLFRGRSKPRSRKRRLSRYDETEH